MTPRKVPANWHQVKRLLDDVGAGLVPDPPAGDHLTDDDFVAYVTELPTLDAAALARIEGHLEGCAECAAEMDHVAGVAEAWGGPSGTARVEALASKLQSAYVRTMPALERLRALLGSVRPAAAFVTAAAGSHEAESEGAIDHIHVSEDQQGNLRVAISSFDVGLAGTRILIDPFAATVTLERVGNEQVGGEIVIERASRTGLAAGAVLTFRIASPE
jgi:hypothetical protein